MKSRAVIKDVGRVLGFEPSETDRITKLIPNAPGQAFTVQAVDGLKEVKACTSRTRTPAALRLLNDTRRVS